MVFDTLKNCEFYYGLHKNFEKAFDFIKKVEKENLPAGRYDFGGEDIYGLVQEYDTKDPKEHKFEGHRKYIDIQYICSGTEVIDVLNITKAISVGDYIEEREVEFFDGGENVVKSVMEKGNYGIFWPCDIHKPGLRLNKEVTPIRKVLVKIKI